MQHIGQIGRTLHKHIHLNRSASKMYKYSRTPHNSNDAYKHFTNKGLSNITIIIINMHIKY